MRTNNAITRFTDLDREEVRVRKRLKKQEDTIKQKFKTLPEEIVTAGVTKVVTGILSGNAFKSAISIVKTVGSVLSGNKNEGSGHGILNIIKNIIKNKLSD